LRKVWPAAVSTSVEAAGKLSLPRPELRPRRGEALADAAQGGLRPAHHSLIDDGADAELLRDMSQVVAVAGQKMEQGRGLPARRIALAQGGKKEAFLQL